MLHIADLASNNFNGTLSTALLNSWKAMMRDDAMLGPEFGHLFFEIVNYHPMSLKDALPSFRSNYLAMKMVKIVANMSRSFLDQAYVDGNSISVDRGRYQDSVIIVNKGQKMKLVKIQKAFTYVDMSNNYLEGPIPDDLMQFKALNGLNLSHNSFLGHIPSSVGNLKNLESMDLSNNSLNGHIPQELSSLNFLEYINISFNHLEGKIPLGTQIQSFDADSFKGNEGLCGPPLTNICGYALSAYETPHSHNESLMECSFLSIELGFIFGFGVFVLPIICSEEIEVVVFQTC
jgi:Leucine-rich repeat (LRR) protein